MNIFLQSKLDVLILRYSVMLERLKKISKNNPQDNLLNLDIIQAEKALNELKNEISENI